MNMKRSGISADTTQTIKELNVAKKFIKWMMSIVCGLEDEIPLENYFIRNCKIDDLIDIANKKIPHHTSKVQKRFNLRFYKQRERFIMDYWN